MEYLSPSTPRCLRHQAIWIKQLMMRVCIYLSLAALPFQASSQGEWSVLLDHSPYKLNVNDAVEANDGSLQAIVCQAISQSSPGAQLSRSWLAHLDGNGGLLQLDELQVDVSRSLIFPALVPDPLGDGLLSVGYSWIQSDLSGHGLVSCRINGDGTHTFSPVHLVSNGEDRLFFQNISIDVNGQLFITGYSWPYSSIFNPNRLLLGRIATDGSDLSYILLGTGPNYRVGRHAVRSDTLMMVSMDGGSGMGPDGISKVLRFDEEFNYVDGFALPSLGGSGNFFELDSVMKDCLYLTASVTGSTYMSGRFRTASLGTRAALVLLSAEGQYMAQFMPRSQYFADYTGSYQGHDTLSDGRIIFAMVENFFPGPPDPELGNEPSRIRIYRLDSLLNVECEFLLDGFEDNAYYYLTRIKAASDGGVLLMGSRRDLLAMEQPRGWIMKLGPDQCHMGVQEHRSTEATVFPNPGHGGFTVLVNGPAIRGGQLELYDALGGQVAAIEFDGNIATVDASILANGLYVYRIMDRTGLPLARGRWVKE
ncbi:MAG: T9SS type A sorting domain-containing protein [Flavobacteriales bacterium]|nr:T9SS type A sorting domain-containing protein [Flavobacteriales bacterium]